MTHPTLYQKTQTGAIQQWTISVDTALGPGDEVWGVLVTEHGQVGGKLQTTSDTIREGKNPGKKNATTPLQQAEKEAKARWTKQLKKGYVDTIAAAEAGEVDAVITGGVPPMLAPNKSYPKDPDLAKAIEFPCYYQPKLDGMRCIAFVVDGKCTLWTRTRKPIPTVPHIAAALEKAFPAGRVVLDGELYNHEYRERFEDLMSLLRGDEPDAEGEYLNAQYHVYDLLEQDVLAAPTSMADAFETRNSAVTILFNDHIGVVNEVRRVPTTFVFSMNQLVTLFEASENEGYEGGMARNSLGKYESDKRSKHLQKMKNWIYQEFPIVGVNEGRGKDAGTVATFDVQLPDGKICPVRLAATYDHRRKMLQKPEMWRGKQLTVKFKRWTADKTLYIPTGQGVRDYE